MFGKKNRVMIVKGTDSSREIYDITGVIKMITGTKKLEYWQIGNNVHMFEYQSTDAHQRDLQELLKKECQHLDFGFLHKKDSKKKEERAK